MQAGRLDDIVALAVAQRAAGDSVGGNMSSVACYFMFAPFGFGSTVAAAVIADGQFEAASAALRAEPLDCLILCLELYMSVVRRPSFPVRSRNGRG